MTTKPNRLDKEEAIAFQLGRADAGDFVHGVERGGLCLSHRDQRGVVKNDIRRDVLFFGNREAQGAQFFEQIFFRARRDFRSFGSVGFSAA